MSEEKFIINGGHSLKGEIEARGSKNAAFGVLAATLLTDKECIIKNIPLIEDIYRMLELLESMGVKVEWLEERTLKINAKNLSVKNIRKDLVLKFRGSVLLFGPLLARFGEVSLPHPGGCIIGVRPISTHLDAFAQMGVNIKPEKDCFTLSLDKSKRQDRVVILNEFSVTATENLLLLASVLKGKTQIRIADMDYQVQELSRFLKKMGVKIKGAGTHYIEIEGVQKLGGVEKHNLIYDPIEAGTFILAAAAARGNVVVKNIEYDFLEFPIKKLRDFGVPIEIINKKTLRVKPWKSLKIDKLQSLPFPGMPSDLLSAFGVLATQAQGSTLFHDPMYNGRLKYMEGLTKMGAEIYFADPHRAIINGPSILYGTDVGSFDLRGGAALIMAGIIASGKTTISNIYQVDRGYERIEERLQNLGSDIQRVKK